jgi:hypothetical protein
VDIREGTIMDVWFEGYNTIECNFQRVRRDIENIGEHYLGLTSFMPNLTSIELVEQGIDFVTIKTSEGLIKRSNIKKVLKPDSLVLEFDEETQTGSMLTTKAHVKDKFTKNGPKVIHRTIISNFKAPGLLGFIYRKIGKTKTGNAYFTTYKTYFETRIN